MAVSNIATYRVEQFIEAAGLTKTTFRSARQRGLRVLQFGKGRFVRGADWESFLLSHNQPTGDEG